MLKPQPANLDLDDHLRRIAEQERVRLPDIEKVFSDCQDHALNTGRISADWPAAWARWCRTHVEKRTGREKREKPAKSRFQMF